MPGPPNRLKVMFTYNLTTQAVIMRLPTTTTHFIFRIRHKFKREGIFLLARYKINYPLKHNLNNLYIDRYKLRHKLNSRYMCRSSEPVKVMFTCTLTTQAVTMRLAARTTHFIFRIRLEFKRDGILYFPATT